MGNGYGPVSAKRDLDNIQIADDELAELFGNFFDAPKPVSLLADLARAKRESERQLRRQSQVLGDGRLMTVEMCASRLPRVRNVTSHSEPGVAYQVEAGHGCYQPTCTCQAYKYAKPDVAGRKTCKHIKEVEGNICSYHQYYDGPTDLEGTCPKCQGPTVPVVLDTQNPG